ncbi:hypothetical protein CHELA20_54195 [Hyphomicrobiales bacterium]|nr:hypothetical protein CHELA20_54195 [Hyphomicrobiales bacterium]
MSNIIVALLTGGRFAEAGAVVSSTLAVGARRGDGATAIIRRINGRLIQVGIRP